LCIERHQTFAHEPVREQRFRVHKEAFTLGVVSPDLGWRYRILMDSVDGRIRVDSGEFRAARRYCAVFYSLFGLFDPTDMDSGIGLIRSTAGFGWCPGPRNPNPPTQLKTNKRWAATTIHDPMNVISDIRANN